MGGEEGNGEIEGLVLGALVEKVEGVILVALGDVNLLPIGHEIPMPAMIGAAEVEFFRGDSSIVPLADVTDVVAMGAQEGGVAFLEGRFPHLEATALVARHPLASEEAGTADSTDGGGHAVLGKSHPRRGEFVEVGGLDHRIARDPQGVMPPVIGIKEDDVERLFGQSQLGKKEEESDGEEAYHGKEVGMISLASNKKGVQEVNSDEILAAAHR